MRPLLVSSLAVLAVLASAQTAPRPAQTLLDEAIAKAKKDDKVVFLAFHASWCGWCHRLEKFLDDPAIKPTVQKRLVVLWLDCQERGEKKSLENPGVDAVMAKYKSDQAGLPSMHLIDGEGKLIATSIREKSGNIGYPGQDDEIEHFRQMLKAARFTDQELAPLVADLKARAAKLKRQAQPTGNTASRTRP